MTIKFPVAFVGFALMLWLGIPGASRATESTSTTQSLDNARTSAEKAVRDHFTQPGSRVEVSAEPADRRLKVAECEQPLRAIVPDQEQPRSRITVQVQCPDAGSWTVRVPIRLQLFRSVLVSTRALLRGDGIHVTDVHTEERDVTRLGYGYLENIEQTAGRTLARAIAPGTVLNPATLGGRRMVRAGDHVQMLAQLEGIEVRADGIALGSGDNGARLRVRNANSGRVIDAMVSAPGVVVALP